MEQGAPREMLRRSSQNLFLVEEDRASSAKKTVLRRCARRDPPGRVDSALGQEPDDARTQAIVRVDVIGSHSRVGARENHRPGQVSGSMQEAGSTRGPSDGRDAGLRGPGEVRNVARDSDPVRNRAVREDRRTDGRDSPTENHFVRADVLRARDPDIDPRRETR
jgi:hypothetical protein